MIRENLKSNYGVDITEDKYDNITHLAGLGGGFSLFSRIKD